MPTRLDLARLEGLLEAFARLRLVVLGDVILDEYLWGEVDRVSPEAPVPVVRIARESVVLGGAGNVVRNVVALGAECRFCTLVGDDGDGRTVIDLLKEQGLDTAAVIVEEGRPTTRKTRVVARSQQIVRFDRETDASPAEDAQHRLGEAFTTVLAGCDGAVLQDYAKGLFAGSGARSWVEELVRAEVPFAVDPKGDLEVFRGAALVKPNLREAEELAGVRCGSDADLDRIAAALQARLPGSDLVITRGQEGLCLYEAGERLCRKVPTLAQEVYDMQGAGDTSIAALALATRAGASLLEAALIANAAAGAVVGKVGTATATRDEVRNLLPAAMEKAEAQLLVAARNEAEQ